MQRITVRPISPPRCEWDDCARPARFSVMLEAGRLYKAHTFYACGAHVGSIKDDLRDAMAWERWKRLRATRGETA